jgi:RNA recognition motif-containing protein
MNEKEFAFVKYYSKKSAVEAQQKMDKFPFHGKPCKLRFSSSSKARTRDMALDINRSIELLNYYVGFNEWSSSILALNQELLEFDESTMHFRCTYACNTSISLRDGRSIEGIGQATSGGNDRSTVIEFAKKNAVTDSRKNAFSLIALVLLGEGKTAVHFLSDGLQQWETQQ